MRIKKKNLKKPIGPFWRWTKSKARVFKYSSYKSLFIVFFLNWPSSIDAYLYTWKNITSGRTPSHYNIIYRHDYRQSSKYIKKKKTFCATFYKGKRIANTRHLGVPRNVKTSGIREKSHTTIPNNWPCKYYSQHQRFPKCGSWPSNGLRLNFRWIAFNFSLWQEKNTSDINDIT